MKYIKRIEKPLLQIGEKLEQFIWDEKIGRKLYEVVDIKIKRWIPLSKYPKETREDYFYTLKCSFCGHNFETNDLKCGVWIFHQEECQKYQKNKTL